MSTLSSLIDELNKSADEWNGSNMFELARMCREAADTIWQLRDDLQRAHDDVRDAEHDESRAWDRVRKAEAEAAKLRELVRRLYNMADFCRNCPDTERCDVDVEWLGCTVADPIDKLMEELGVEV